MDKFLSRLLLACPPPLVAPDMAAFRGSRPLFLVALAARTLEDFDRAFRRGCEILRKE